MGNFLKEKDGTLLEVSVRPTDILFLQCPPWDVSMPAMGIAYLSSYLKKSGYKTSVSDLNLSLYHLVQNDLKYLWDQKSYDCWVEEELFKNTWFNLKEITYHYAAEILQKIDTKYIGLSVNFAGIKFANELIKIIKVLKNESKIILGGWGCITEQMRFLFPKDKVDVFIVGEGEETLKEVIEALEGKRKTGDVSGAVFNKDRNSVYKQRPPITNLDSIPWPRFSEFQLERYTAPMLPLFTSRGCIGRCSFCNDWRTSVSFRYRSAHNVFEEIKYHIEHNKIRIFSFKDLLCNGDINRLNLLADLIINSGLKFQWDSQAIPRKEMTYELLCKLKESGCGALIYGVESFSNNVLKRMRKIFTREVAEQVIKDTCSAGIHAMINIIVGFPGETEDDLRQTLEAIERNQKFIFQMSAISVCLVNNDSDLEFHPHNYGITLSTEPGIRAKMWESSDGHNTYAIRKKRAEEVIGLINRLGLPYVTTTV